MHHRSSGTALAAVMLIGAGCAAERKIPRVQPEPVPILCRAADHVLAAFPAPPPFDWGEGVLMAGMMRAGAATGDARYVAFVRKWADHWRERGIEPLLEEKGYCGHWGPGFPVLMLHEKTKDASYLAMAQQIVDFMQTRATRTDDGGLGHWGGNRQLWVDTLFMSCPVYANVGRLTSQPALLEEAARQLAVSANHLQDDETGLFYHMYDEPGGQRTTEPWGRGNGWTAMAYVEVLRFMDRGSPMRSRLVRDFRRLARGLTAMQDRASGLWHTVLTRPEAYLETSASAMILYSLVEADRMGILTIEDRDLVQRAWSGLVTQVDARGRVVGVSDGTGPAEYEAYVNVKRGTYTWGTGAFLLAAAAMAK